MTNRHTAGALVVSEGRGACFHAPLFAMVHEYSVANMLFGYREKKHVVSGGGLLGKGGDAG